MPASGSSRWRFVKGFRARGCSTIGFSLDSRLQGRTKVGGCDKHGLLIHSLARRIASSGLASTCAEGWVKALAACCASCGECPTGPHYPNTSEDATYICTGLQHRPYDRAD